MIAAANRICSAVCVELDEPAYRHSIRCACRRCIRQAHELFEQFVGALAVKAWQETYAATVKL